MSWHWKVMQNLKENWLVACKMSSRNSENLHFDGFLLPKAYEVLDEKAQRVCLLTLRSDAKFEEKLTLGSKNDMRNLVYFNMSSVKSENLHFDELLLSLVYYVWVKKKYKGVMCHDTEEWRKIWRGTDLCFEKWCEKFGEIWWISLELSKISKVCTLRNFFVEGMLS